MSRKTERGGETPLNVYLAGPMRGLPEHNFPAFLAAAADLRARGCEVFSPAEVDLNDGFDPASGNGIKEFRRYMEQDLAAVCRAEAVVVLPGWQRSQGAKLETFVARACDIPVLRYPDLQPARHRLSDLFHDALRQLGDLHDVKQMDYGTDSDPFANIRASEEFGIPAWLGAIVRGNDKVSRLKTFARKGSLANESVIDSFNDLAVYSVIGRILFEEGNE